MNHFILDASALGKRYVRETGDVLMDRLFRDVEPNRLRCLTLGALETMSIIVRKHNAELISDEAAQDAIAALQREVFFGAIQLLPAPDALILAAATLVERHNVNSTDAILLRAALDIRVELREQGDGLVLVSSDLRLLRAADNQGLPTFNPQTEGIPALQALAHTG